MIHEGRGRREELITSVENRHNSTRVRWIGKLFDLGISGACTQAGGRAMAEKFLEWVLLYEPVELSLSLFLSIISSPGGNRSLQRSLSAKKQSSC